MGFIDFILNPLVDADNYEERKVAPKILPEKNNGIGVSTCWVSDEQCYETALLDETDIIPVERYRTREEAIKGHYKWKKWARNPKNNRVKELFWRDMPEFDKVVRLKRVKIFKK